MRNLSVTMTLKIGIVYPSCFHDVSMQALLKAYLSLHNPKPSSEYYLDVCMHMVC